jgi:hypothetical protein
LFSDYDDRLILLRDITEFLYKHNWNTYSTNKPV